jgi:hypothetical protein
LKPTKILIYCIAGIAVALIISLMSSGLNSVTSGTFSNISCSQDFSAGFGLVKMTGYFTNGPFFSQAVGFKMGVIDSSGRIVATGAGTLLNVQPNETYLFDAMTLYDGSFSSCKVQEDYRL